MEKFYLEKVNLDRKDDIVDYVSEFKEYNSDIHGTGGFHHILDGKSFESILEKEGYAKLNLYLGLIKSLEEFDLEKVMIDCSATNVGSEKTIQALGGVFERIGIDWYDNELTNVYWIDTKDSIDKYKDNYSDYIYNKQK